MSTLFDELEKRARELTREEKASLARPLIDELDASADAGAEQLWIEEAYRRYDAYCAGELKAVPGEDAIARARSRLK
jgi:putative addiction module component (TIGR02574 family)